jgi:hypothetical protein
MSRNNRRREEREERAKSRRAQRVIEAQQAKRRRMLTLIGGVVGGAVIISGLLFLFSREPTPAAADEPVVSAPAPAIEVETEGRFKGNPEAPVTLVEFGDFQ